MSDEQMKPNRQPWKGPFVMPKPEPLDAVILCLFDSEEATDDAEEKREFQACREIAERAKAELTALREGRERVLRLCDHAEANKDDPYYYAVSPFDLRACFSEPAKGADDCVCGHAKTAHEAAASAEIGSTLRCTVEGCACGPGCIHEGYVTANYTKPEKE